MPYPLISIGIPTYNRSLMLDRAVKSALEQSYPNLEIIVSDNASSDGTEVLCGRAQRDHPNLVYIKHQVNQGAVRNFLAARDAARGEYFMWLADDDWLDRDYVQRCAEFLTAHPDYVLACGRDLYFHGPKPVSIGESLNLQQSSPFIRVLSYFSQVRQNGMFYGLMRTQVAKELTFPNELAGDWFLMAQVALAGKTVTIETVQVNRTCGGASGDLADFARKLGYSEAAVRRPWLEISKSTFKHVAGRSANFKKFPWAERIVLACCAAIIVYWRKHLLHQWVGIKRVWFRHVGWRFHQS